MRRLEAIGRFAAVPPLLTVERVYCHNPTGTDGLLLESFTPVTADSEAVEPDQLRAAERVLAALPDAEDNALTVPTLRTKLGMPDSTIRHALRTLEDRVRGIGAGTRSDPKRFMTTKSNRTTTPQHSGLGCCDHALPDTLSWQTNERAPPSAENDAQAPELDDTN